MALLLDREMRLIPNWKHFSNELKVDVNVINRLEQYADFSPTIRLFEYLETTQPNLTIQQLKQALLDIGRKDLFSLLTRTGLPVWIQRFSNPLNRPKPPVRIPQGVYSGFQVSGTSFEIFDSGSFLGSKIWQVFFLVAWFK